MKQKIGINLYMVIWTDATHILDPDEKNVTPMVAADFGFILKASKKYLVLGTEFFTEGHTRQAMSIPMGMVKNIKKVARVKMPKQFKSHPTL
ncbi:hypothetical protein LCGC14_1471710 [marine sediment metagenome]|uniref:Uncharacterized protein n=1 Tax=marine sediment metagenome TaxID=412755 RepID=A0A0F9JCU9_9ZZZZ